jgi:hypothetical protein
MINEELTVRHEELLLKDKVFGQSSGVIVAGFLMLHN